MAEGSETRVRMHVTRWCGYCRAAKSLLDREGIPYDEFDVTNDPAGRDAIRRTSGWRTVPVIFIDDELVGGFTELSALHRRGQLDTLKAKAS